MPESFRKSPGSSDETISRESHDAAAKGWVAPSRAASHPPIGAQAA